MVRGICEKQLAAKALVLDRGGGKAEGESIEKLQGIQLKEEEL